MTMSGSGLFGGSIEQRLRRVSGRDGYQHCEVCRLEWSGERRQQLAPPTTAIFNSVRINLSYSIAYRSPLQPMRSYRACHLLKPHYLGALYQRQGAF